MLTKKEIALVKSEKAIVEKSTTDESCRVFLSLTRGELLALQNALDCYGTPVGEDVRSYVNRAISKAGVTF